jgi:hypothetical protein
VSELFNRLFGLSSLSFGDEGVQLAWARPIPAWGWFLAILAAAALAGWSYWKLEGPSRSRGLLAGVRALVLLLILVIISGPQLIRPNDRVEKDWVLALVDRSASMSILDAPGPAPASRDQQLQAALSAAWPSLAALASDRTVRWMGFDSGIFDLPMGSTGPDGSAPALGTPQGRRTSIGAALDQALARAAARPISGVLILSDGRSIDEPTRQAMRRLQAERIPVFTVPLGSPDPVADLAIARAEAPAMAFVNDNVPVGVEVERLGMAAAAAGRVQLIEKTTGRVLDEKPLPTAQESWPDQRTRLTLTVRQAEAGRLTWLVKLIPGGADLVAENNQAEVSVELVDRPMRVVYFDGYPRWEARYLRNLLLRETSIRSASLYLASSRRYTQEGDITLDTLPRSPEDWARFDVIMLGDVAPTVFSRDQLEQIRDHVAIRGAGLMWIGGPAATPGAWRDTPLADLLPFSLGAGGLGESTVRAWEEPVLMAPTPAASRLNLLELGDSEAEPWPARLADPRTGWSQLRYAQRIESSALKPTAEILARFIPASEAASAHQPDRVGPAVISMRYGAGRVLYIATDEIWRWRYARGEVLPERFWLPLLRLQGRESLARSSRPAVIEAAPRRAQVEQPVRVSIQLVDQALADTAPPSLTVRIRPVEGDDPGRARPAAELTLSAEPEAAPSSTRIRGARAFSASWVPAEPGRYRLDAADPMLSSLQLSTDLEVLLPEDELRHPETNHPLLAHLSQSTQGQVLSASRLAELPALLPNREVHIAGTPDIQTLWDKPPFLILLLLLLTAEWVGRRLIRLP